MLKCAFLFGGYWKAQGNNCYYGDNSLGTWISGVPSRRIWLEKAEITENIQDSFGQMMLGIGMMANSVLSQMCITWIWMDTS